MKYTLAALAIAIATASPVRADWNEITIIGKHGERCTVQVYKRLPGAHAAAVRWCKVWIKEQRPAIPLAQGCQLPATGQPPTADDCPTRKEPRR